MYVCCAISFFYFTSINTLQSSFAFFHVSDAVYSTNVGHHFMYTTPRLIAKCSQVPEALKNSDEKVLALLERPSMVYCCSLSYDGCLRIFVQMLSLKLRLPSGVVDAAVVDV